MIKWIIEWWLSIIEDTWCLKQNLKLMIWGLRDQLKQILISIMVTLTGCRVYSAGDFYNSAVKQGQQLSGQGEETKETEWHMNYKGYYIIFNIIFNTQYSHVIITSHLVHCCTCVYILYLLRSIVYFYSFFILFLFIYQYMSVYVICMVCILC